MNEITHIQKSLKDLPCNLYIRCIPLALKSMLTIISSFGPISCIEIVPEKAGSPSQKEPEFLSKSFH